jgi:hypothetical protein
MRTSPEVMVDVKRPSIDKTQIEFDGPSEPVEAGDLPSCFAQDQENMLADVQGDGDRQADNLPVLPTFHGDGEVTDKAQACREGGVLSFGGVISTQSTLDLDRFGFAPI